MTNKLQKAVEQVETRFAAGKIHIGRSHDGWAAYFGSNVVKAPTFLELVMEIGKEETNVRGE